LSTPAASVRASARAAATRFIAPAHAVHVVPNSSINHSSVQFPLVLTLVVDPQELQHEDSCQRSHVSDALFLTEVRTSVAVKTKTKCNKTKAKTKTKISK